MEKPIVIFSGSLDVLGRALTNPTHYNPKNPKATSMCRGGLGKYDFLNNGIYYKGQEYIDVESAFFDNRNKLSKEGLPADDFMVDLIYTKLFTYRQLIADIEERGGLEWLQKCIHTYNAADNPETFIRGRKFNDIWTSHGQDLFMRCLIRAYKIIT